MSELSKLQHEARMIKYLLPPPSIFYYWQRPHFTYRTRRNIRSFPKSKL